MQINQSGKLIEEIQQSDVDFSKGEFVIKLTGGGHININPEWIPGKYGIITSGRFHILYFHPEQGTIIFYLQYTDLLKWHSECCLSPLIDECFIKWIGKQIDNYSS